MILQLRSEIYSEPYASIDWLKARDAVAPVDVYAPHHKLLDYANCKSFYLCLIYSVFLMPFLCQLMFVFELMVLFKHKCLFCYNWLFVYPSKFFHVVAVFSWFEGQQWSSLREKALLHVLDHIRADDMNTDYISIGPVRLTSLILLYFIILSYYHLQYETNIFIL